MSSGNCGRWSKKRDFDQFVMNDRIFILACSFYRQLFQKMSFGFGVDCRWSSTIESLISMSLICGSLFLCLLDLLIEL